MGFKKYIKKIIYKQKADSVSYISHLRKIGCKVGERVTIYAPRKTLIDETKPWLIDIGNDVKITEGVTILTHGYDWAVLKRVYGDVIGSAGNVKIGNNVFIGVNTTILKGTTIGNNVIIGANSLVNRNIPDNVVAAGNPAKVIMSLDEYYEKRKKEQLNEAIELVKKYRERYGKDPNEKILREHFWIFTNSNVGLPECWNEVNGLCGNREETEKRLKQNKPLYRDMEQFLKDVK